MKILSKEKETEFLTEMQKSEMKVSVVNFNQETIDNLNESFNFHHFLDNCDLINFWPAFSASIAVNQNYINNFLAID